MIALLRRVRRSPFARDLREGLAVFGPVFALLATLFLGVQLGMAIDDLVVTVDPSTGQAVFVEVPQ